MSVLALLFIAGLAHPPAAASTELTPQERQFALTYLDETRQKFLASINGLSDAQWTYKPAPERWSIAETAEHIAVSETTILQLITEKIMKGPVAPAGTERPADKMVVDIIADRSFRAQAPEMLRPTNRWSDRAALTKDFNAARDKTAAYVKETKDNLRGHVMAHPAAKTIDAYQWVLLLAAHSARHTAQIEEVKTAAGYPKR